ncbi:MAG: cytochrome c oxidase assembly protein [Candidatus Eiseniibacteriota bacterium]
MIGALALAVLYLWAVGPLRKRKGWAPRFPVGHAITFFGGLGIMLVALNGPIHDLSDYYLFSIHMVQHLMLTEIWAPLFILGLPAWLVRGLVVETGLGRVARFWGSPLVGGGIFTACLALWHTIPFYDLMMRNHDIHIACHLMFMVTAVMSWWCVCCRVPEAGKIKEPAAMLYLFLLGVPMQILAAIITLSDRVLYPWYQTAPRVWGLTPLADQQFGGLIMWIPGGLALWIAITALWIVWARKSDALKTGLEGADSSGGSRDDAPPLTLPGISRG